MDFNKRDGLKHVILQLYIFQSLCLQAGTGKIKILQRNSRYQAFRQFNLLSYLEAKFHTFDGLAVD